MKNVMQGISELISELREVRRAGRGMPVIVFAYSHERGVLAAVEHPRNSHLARGVLDFVRSEGPLRDPGGATLRPVKFRRYNPHQFHKPMPHRRRRPRPAHGIITGLASRVVVPTPIGLAAVFVDGQDPRFKRVGETPGAARLLVDLQPNLAAFKSDAGWFRAEVSLGELYDGETSPLKDFFKATEPEGDE